MTSHSPSQLAALWRWLLALLVLALLVWWVGKRVAGGPRPEIGVTGDRDVPRVVAPGPTPVEPDVVEQAAPTRPVEPAAPAAPGEPSRAEPAPAAPSPRR